MDEKTPGRRAFEAYEATVVLGSAEQPLAWEALIPDRKKAWENAAQAVREPVTAVDEDETGIVTLSCRADLALADSFVLGWKQAVMAELDRMRAEMPYADFLDLRLVCVRRPPV